MGQKIEGALSPFRGGAAVSPSNTMLLGSRPTSLLSGILVHPAIWPQQIWAENWGAVPLWGRGSCVSMYQNVARAETYLCAKFHVDPANGLATTDMGRKLAAVVPLFRGRTGSHLTQRGLGQGLPPYQMASLSIQPFGHNYRHGSKMGAVPPFWGGGLGPHLTQCDPAGPRPSFILIQPTV